MKGKIPVVTGHESPRLFDTGEDLLRKYLVQNFLEAPVSGIMASVFYCPQALSFTLEGFDHAKSILAIQRS